MITQAIDQVASLELRSRLLCHAAIELDRGAPIVLGQTPWRWMRVSNISGGQFDGERLRGEVLRAGGDWAEQGHDATGLPTSMLDVRSLWRTDDGALIHVTYGGRVVLPADIAVDYRDLSRVDSIDPSRYYFRNNPLFQTADARYAWLNNVVTVGLGKRTATGVIYKIYEIL